MHACKLKYTLLSGPREAEAQERLEVEGEEPRPKVEVEEGVRVSRPASRRPDTVAAGELSHTGVC